MKRLALLAACLLSCTSQLPPSTTAEAIDAPFEETTERPVEERVALDDRYAPVLPLGAFASIEAFCARQRDLVFPRLAEARGELDDDSREELVPSCEENVAALDEAPVALGGPYLDLKAVQIETGSTTGIFLVARTSEGWTALREELVSAAHDDPGCGSIQRENAIVEVRVDRGAIVILTSADRLDDARRITLTQMRSCRMTTTGTRCTEPETVETTFASTEE